MELKERLGKIIQPICENAGFYLVHLEVKGDRHKPVIQVYADSERGIDIDDCAQLSRLIQDALDMNLDELSNYRLDVSSPGVDHDLKFDWEFRKNLGRELEVHFLKDDRNVKKSGKLVDIDNDLLYLETKEGKTEIQRASIYRAKVKLQW